MLPSWNRFPGRFSIILILTALLLAALELINGRFWLNDFRVYYDAANALLSGAPLYGVAHGLDSGFFKYAPAMALLYVPLAILPYSIAAGIQYALIVGAFVGSVVIADRLVRTHVLGGKAAGYTPLFLTLLIVVVHLHRELHLGNINVLLLWSLLLALDRLLSGDARAAGLFMGIAMLAKPHFVVLLPLLLLRGHYRAMSAALLTLAVGLLVPALVLGWSTSWDLHGQWLAEMAKHNASLIYTGGDAYNSVDTVYSFLHRAALRYVLAGPSALETMVILACMAGVVGTVVLVHRSREREHGGAPGHLLSEYFLLLALVPSITLTDTNHFLLTTPAVLLLIHQVRARGAFSWPVVPAVLLFLLYGGNWADALGALSHRMVHYGVLGMANIGIIALLVVLALVRSNHSPGKASS